MEFDSFHQRMSGKKAKALPHVVRYLRRATDKTRLVTNFNIREFIAGRGIDLLDSEVRFIIRHIRLNSLVERLVATNGGYYIESSNKRFKQYCSRLNRRGMKIVALSREMLKQCS